MEKLDAARNNMSQGLCMFGPDNRLLLWNDRYVKMYRLAPDCLRVGCTLDMLEARKAAGTAYRDLGQYGTKLLRRRATPTTSSPTSTTAEELCAHLVTVTSQFASTVMRSRARISPAVVEAASAGVSRSAARSASVHRLFGL
jgi:PAS domain-containing protein